MSRPKVLVNFIQDRSGSMASVWEETTNGFKTFLNDLKEKAEQDGVDYLFSLTVFDTVTETPLLAVPIGNVGDDALAKHGPRGATALYDAVGKTLEAISQSGHGADKIVVAIVTDGHENSSREWTKDGLNKVVEDRLKQGNWAFTYLGTQPETWADAQAIGIGAGATAVYDSSRASASYAVMAKAIRSHARSSERGSRDLFAQNLNQPEAAAGGMKTNPSESEQEPNKTTGSQRRWQ